MLINGCTSPADVNANRQVIDYTDINKELSGKELQFNLYEINFIDVAYGSSLANYVILTNLSNKDIIIESFKFKNHSNLFKVLSPSLPFILTKHKTDSSTRELIISFNAVELGEFRDTLIVNDLKHPQLNINSKVPFVDVTDVDFGFQKVGQSKVKPPLYIYNHSDRKVIIRDFKLIDPEEVFQVLSTIPAEIPANSKFSIIVKFSPHSEKPYNGRIEFKIDGVQGYIDNTSQLTGYGIQ